MPVRMLPPTPTGLVRNQAVRDPGAADRRALRHLDAVSRVGRTVYVLAWRGEPDNGPEAA